MKKVTLMIIALLLGVYAQATNMVYWNWGAMPSISSSGINVYCLPASAAVKVDFQYDYNLVVGSTRQYRAQVELKKVGGGASYYSGWGFISTAHSSSYPVTLNSGTKSTSINVSSSGLYEAVVYVQYQTYNSSLGTWSSWVNFGSFNSTATGPEFQFNKGNSEFSFTVNGKSYSANGGAPTQIVLCNGEELKIDGISNLGTNNRIDVQLESAPEYTGYYPLISGFIDLTSLWGYGSIPLSAGPLSPYLFGGPSRFIRVKIRVYGPCDPPPGYVEKTMVFEVIDASAFVDFQMMASSCGGSTGNARQTTLPIPDATFTSSPCIPGWQGATSAGIVSFNTAGSTGPITGYNVKIDEVNPFSGAYLTNISDQTVTGPLPLNYTFGLPTSGYFFDPLNFPSLSTTNRTFKVTLTVNTDNCSSSAYSYFRIAGSNRFYKIGGKESPEVGVLDGKILNPIIYPNPSTDKLYVKFDNMHPQASISLRDNLGREVLRKENLGVDGPNIDIRYLSDGIYFYTFESGGEIFQGKLIKN